MNGPRIIILFSLSLNNATLEIFYSNVLIFGHMVFDFVWYSISSKENHNRYSKLLWCFVLLLLLLLELPFSEAFNFTAWLNFNIRISNIEYWIMFIAALKSQCLILILWHRKAYRKTHTHTLSQLRNKVRIIVGFLLSLLKLNKELLFFNDNQRNPLAVYYGRINDKIRLKTFLKQ